MRAETCAGKSLQILETFSKCGVSNTVKSLDLLNNSDTRITITNDVLYQLSYTGLRGPTMALLTLLAHCELFGLKCYLRSDLIMLRYAITSKWPIGADGGQSIKTNLRVGNSGPCHPRRWHAGKISGLMLPRP